MVLLPRSVFPGSFALCRKKSFFAKQVKQACVSPDDAMTRLTTFLLFLLSSTFAKGLLGTDSFGHFWGDEGQYTLLDFEWVEISESGEKVLAPESADKVNLKLNPPLVLYGKSHPEVAVSVNGYISSDPTDDGGDESNDCPFPGPVSSGGGARIAVLHDNLEM